MILLLVYLFLALFVSALCSIMEAVLLSTPLSFLRSKVENGSTSAQSFIKLKKDIDKPLAAILSLNTVAHTVGAAGVGAQAVAVFGEVYFGVISAVLTILILVFSEIIPKTIGATYWRRLALVSGGIINGMIILTYPLVIVSALITRMLSKTKSSYTISRDEISTLARIGKSEGIFTETEDKIIQNLIHLKSIKVQAICTPRVVLTSVSEKLTVKDFFENREQYNFSRIPVYDKDEEHISGYIFRHSVFEKMAEGTTELLLKDIKREITVVPETMSMVKAWEILLDKKEHIALVVDEFGMTEGIVTMEDIIESLLGFEIVDEKDKVTDMQQYARDRWKRLIRGRNYFDKK